MKTPLIILLVITAFFAFKPLVKKKRVVFFGDSITQAAVQPGGYITLMQQELRKSGKSEQYELVGAGISGNKVPDLQKRLQKDVLAKKPDVVFIYIGINDVWHFVHPSTNGSGTPAHLFEAGLTDIINQITQSGAKVVVCTPSMIGEKTDGTNEQDPMLDQYADISRKVAQATGSQLCDLRKAFLTHLKQHNPTNQEKNILTTDGVHLNAAGNAFVAKAMAKWLE